MAAQVLTALETIVTSSGAPSPVIHSIFLCTAVTVTVAGMIVPLKICSSSSRITMRSLRPLNVATLMGRVLRDG